MSLILFIDGSPNPTANLPVLPFAYRTLYSDTFTGGNTLDINGRTTDSGLGGTGLTWLSQPNNSYAIIDNTLVRGSYTTGISGAALKVGASDMRITLSIGALTSTNVFFDFRKASPNLGATITECYRLRISSTGLVEVQKKVGSAAASVISVGTHTVTANSTLGLSIEGNTLTLFINNAPQETIVDTGVVLNGEYFEIYQGSSATIALKSINIEKIE